MEQAEQAWREVELWLQTLLERIQALLGIPTHRTWTDKVFSHPTVQTVLNHPLAKNNAFVFGLLGVIVMILALYFDLLPGDESKPKRSGRKGGSPTVLLVGPSDGGKTSLFVNLVQNEYPQTHTSIQISDTTFPLLHASDTRLKSKDVRLIDIPGHPRLKDEVKKHVGDATAVVFVVDIVNLVRNASAVAEQLPPLLTLLASTSSRRNPPGPIRLLLLAHKSDLLLRPTPPAGSIPSLNEQTRSTAKTRLETILTREMDRLKSSRGSTGGKIEGMSSVPSSNSSFWSRLFGGRTSAVREDNEGEGEDDEALVWGGKGPWRWEDVEGVEVEWGCTGLGGVSPSVTVTPGDVEKESGDGLDDLKEFLWES